jgi:DNA-binding GntR family transcriptional regulator
MAFIKYGRPSTVDNDYASRTSAMPGFRVLTPTSLTESVATQLRDAIAAGRLQPGDRLVEADLAAQMGISRAPVREALRQLEFEGLVEGRARRGYVVRALSAAELIEIYDLRVLLEPVLAHAAATRLKPDELPALKAIVGRMRDAARRADWLSVVAADREFHTQIGRLADRPLTAQIFDHLNEQIRRFTALMRSTYPDIEQSADEHTALLAAIASGNPERAAEEMRLHLEDARQRLASILGEGRLPDGRAAELDGHEPTSVAMRGSRSQET